VRFVDFALPPGSDDAKLCDLHMAVLAGDASSEVREALHHGATRVRVWDPEELASWFRAGGFHDVRVSGRLGEPEAPLTSEDIFLEARTDRSQR
jgi:hypothetical protein